MLDEEKTQIRIANNLTALGLRKGGVVLVHASLRSLGKVPGGAETVVRGLLCALGENGTLLMPALSYAHVDANNPVFDVLNTPSCIGTLPEYFRTRTGTIRSVHPTHSVCGVGQKAESLLKEHYLDTTPCGEHSPFRRLREVKGQILFLGCGMRPNTSMHAVEELVQPPYLLGDPIDYRIILATGKEMNISMSQKRSIGIGKSRFFRWICQSNGSICGVLNMRVKRHNFGIWGQRYDRLGPLLDEDGLKRGKVLEATVDLVDCEQMWEKALVALKKDPFFFVERR